MLREKVNKMRAVLNRILPGDACANAFLSRMDAVANLKDQVEMEDKHVSKLPVASSE